MPLLQLNKLFFGVEEETKSKEILSDINLAVEEDSFVVITGPNGGGKSTLAKLIAGIEQPSSGSIIFEGEDITHKDITERARLGIGFAFQQPVRFKGLTVRDMLSLASGKELGVEEACSYLSEVGLCAADYVFRELNSSLSGGELKRIEIATIVARGTKLSIFDEPEAGIDLWSFRSLIDVFMKMRELTGGAVVIISHQERILEIADTIVVLADGKIEKIGPRDEILPGILQDSDSCHFFREAV